jgi:CheY-like chemotaxis protein
LRIPEKPPFPVIILFSSFYSTPPLLALFLNDPPWNAKPKNHPRESTVEKVRILIVEDEGILALNIQRLLKRLGYDAFCAVSRGEEAEEISRTERPDVILMDIHLKGRMSGLQAAERIRGFLDVPIIFTTAYSDDQTLETAGNMTPSALLMKPYDIAELRAMIEAFSAGRRAETNASGDAERLHCPDPRLSERDASVSTALPLAVSAASGRTEAMTKISLG